MNATISEQEALLAENGWKQKIAFSTDPLRPPYDGESSAWTYPQDDSDNFTVFVTTKGFVLETRDANANSGPPLVLRYPRFEHEKSFRPAFERLSLSVEEAAFLLQSDSY